VAYKLLLADDSVTIQRVIELTFADEDIHVSAVGDGKKAIAAIQADRPDIVLADVGMPERDGYEVAAFIKSNSEFAQIPVLLLTGAFEPIDEARARAVGCDGVLVKPFEPQMVINRVKDLLAGRGKAGAAGTTLGLSGQPARQSAGQADERRGPSTSVPPAAAGSLEDYFDRLDAAFASMEGPSAPPATTAAQGVPVAPRAEAAPDLAPTQARNAPLTGASALPEGIAEWDPDLSGDPRKPAPIEPRPIDLDPSRGFAPSIRSGAPAPAPPAAHSVPNEEARPAPPPTAAPAPRAPAHAEAASSIAPPVPVPTLAEAFAALLSAEQGRTVHPSAAAPVSDDLVEDLVRRVILRMGDRAVRDTVTEVAERLVREEIDRIKSA
jgi:CheY-like chemotaxis protein